MELLIGFLGGSLASAAYNQFFHARRERRQQLLNVIEKLVNHYYEYVRLAKVGRVEKTNKRLDEIHVYFLSSARLLDMLAPDISCLNQARSIAKKLANIVNHSDLSVEQRSNQFKGVYTQMDNLMDEIRRCLL